MEQVTIFLRSLIFNDKISKQKVDVAYGLHKIISKYEYECILDITWYSLDKIPCIGIFLTSVFNIWDIRFRSIYNMNTK